MENNKKTVPVMSVKKALDLLETLLFQDVRRNGVRLSDLAAKLGVPDNTARNLLKTMIECGFVAQTPDSRYVAGKKCQLVGRLNRLSSPAADEEICRALNRFCDKIDETVVLAILADGYRDILAEVSSKKQVKVAYEQTSSVNIYHTATGRILAAYAGQEELAKIVRKYGVPGRFWNDISDVSALEKELALTREKGHVAMQDRETVSFAVPVWDAEDGLVGSVGCYAPSFRWPKKRHGEIIAALSDAAAELASRL